MTPGPTRILLRQPGKDLLLTAALLTAFAILSACGPYRKDGAPRGTPRPSAPDVVPQPEPRSKYGNPPFYEVFGQRYYVLPSADGYRERGVASWYGRKFHGQPTANGEIYDMYAMSAAHKSLPLPTYAEVINLRNDRRVVVRINDRGPFVGNRLIDLSYTAASRLDMLETGTTLVEVRAIDPSADPTRQSRAGPGSAAAGELYVQVGAFGELGNAEQMRATLTLHGIGDVFIREDSVGGRQLYRVRVGPLSGVDGFDATMARLQTLDIHDAHLALD